MVLLRRILAVLTLVLGSAMLLVSLAVGVGVWVVRGEVLERVTGLFGRVEGGFEKADHGLSQAEGSLERASQRLAAAREDQRRLAEEVPRPGVTRRTLARTVQRSVAPEVTDAQLKLQTVAEAAVVVNSVLEDVSTLTQLNARGVDTERLAEMNGRLAEVPSAAWELSRLFSESAPDAEAAEQLAKIDQMLKAMQTLLADYQRQLGEARQRTEDLKARILLWITWGTVLTSVVAFWIALGQLSLLVHAWKWLKGPEKISCDR